MEKRIYILLFVILFFVISCKKGFEEINENPNVSLEANPEELFAYAQLKYHTDYGHGVNTEMWGLNKWMQIQANINGISSLGEEYFIGSDALNNTWQITYANVLGNISEAIRITNDQPEKINENSIYRIYRAYVFHRLTDLWGDIPYSEAHNLVNDENIPDFTPAYDSQESIYIDLLNELEEAKNLFDPSLPSLGMQDWLYQGNVDHWKRFANSIRMRMATRISNISPGLSSEVIQDIIDENMFIQSNEEGAHFPHTSVSAMRSAFYELHSTGQGMRNPSQYLIEKLNSDNDPRIGNYATFTPESIIFGTFEYVGMPSFIPNAQVDAIEYSNLTISYIGDYFLDASLEGTSLGYPEVCFLLAEASLNGVGTPLSPSEYYNNGVSAHMEFMNVNQSEIDEYLQNEGAFDGTLENIINEKWKTLIYTDGIEIFNEWRRTGFPILKDPDGLEINISSIPKRLAYPALEWSLNGQNVMDVGLVQNDFLTPVWWAE
ncbi:MAG: hypothetical protein ACI8XB_002783 [Patiriisocius sp.]|jgi:hypothetical protein